MSKSKVLLVLLLAVLGVLSARVLLMPMFGGEQEYSVVQRESILQTANGWIVQFDIVNREDQDREYTISPVISGRPSTITISVRAGGVFTYIKDIYRDEVGEGEVSFTIYKKGETTSLKSVTYYLQ